MLTSRNHPSSTSVQCIQHPHPPPLQPTHYSACIQLASSSMRNITACSNASPSPLHATSRNHPTYTATPCHVPTGYLLASPAARASIQHVASTSIPSPPRLSPQPCSLLAFVAHGDEVPERHDGSAWSAKQHSSCNPPRDMGSLKLLRRDVIWLLWAQS